MKGLEPSTFCMANGTVGFRLWAPAEVRQDRRYVDGSRGLRVLCRVLSN
jgi:hypothetical protein